MLIFEFPPNLDTYIDGLTTITQLKFLFQYRYFAKRELWTQQTGPPIDVAETKKLGSIKHNSLVFHYFNFVSRKKKKKKKWIQISCFKKNTDLFPDERNKIQKAYKDIKKKKVAYVEKLRTVMPHRWILSLLLFKSYWFLARTELTRKLQWCLHCRKL